MGELITKHPLSFAQAIYNNPSPNYLLACAEHAAAVYLQPSDYGLLAMRAGWRGGTVIERGPAQAGICWYQDADQQNAREPRPIVMISPRGSSEIGDWLGNILSVVRRRWKPIIEEGRIGLGFRRQAKALIKPILDYLNWIEFTYGRKPKIIVNGHSLGAALSPLIVCALRYNGFRVLSCVCFSSPRIGNIEWAEWYSENVNTPTLNIVNVVKGEVDLITRVPKKSWGFRHIGKRYIIVPQEDGAVPKVFIGWDTWKEYRKHNPVGTLAAWRILSKKRAGIQAHFSLRLLVQLRALTRNVECQKSSSEFVT